MSRRSFDRPGIEDTEEENRRRQRRLLAAAVAGGAAIGLPVLLHHWIRRQARPPQSPRWGRAHRFNGRFGAIAFQELGQGRPLALVHAFGPGYDGESFRAAAESLAADYRVLVPDLPGWGRSQLAGRRLDGGLYAAALDEFLAAVAGEPAVVVAAGLPAAYAVQLASDHPERVHALALVVPQGLGAPEHGGSGGRWIDKLLRLPGVRASTLDALTSRPQLERHLREVFAAPERVDAGVLDHHYRVSHRPEARRTFAAYLRGDLDISSDALREAFSRLDRPTLLLWGRHAVLPPVETADLWKKYLPGADLTVIEGSGSLPHAETPALFVRAVQRFLSRLPA